MHLVGQVAHLGRLETVRRYPDCTFESVADLARHIAYTAILDLLVQDYATEAARARDVAEGFIREMAARVAADPHLDLEGMKQAVRTAIDIYAPGNCRRADPHQFRQHRRSGARERETAC